MIQFFRRIRNHHVVKNRVGKYILYAIGEIFLVVIGILIAVTINNRNEQEKRFAQLETYRTSLVQELQQDIINLNKSKEFLLRKRKSIRHYLDYYSTKNPEITILLGRLDSVNTSKSAFYTGTYTIEDLITTGNLSLFPKNEKEAILKLKNLQERYFSYETQTIENIALYDLELKKSTDLLYLNGYSDKQHPSVRNWRNNLGSMQFLVLNNTLAESLKLYDFQEELYGNLSEETTALEKLLNDQTRTTY
ncbi:hypothetical protein FGM00_02630 [Aggregatimonas sangjinii]|uniref:Uncharacterized protein n=1 Tax=Aggregatimonas sangjinii TaxID=2583587 RepID=A0A5B7SKL4_9FLAO|nr:DUF6090 family protein [Aggregatimonas sangjinii]QCW99064.1 hypothetical protein FGM00_02630 [Aggregatimonas sangjinii]